MFIFRVLAMKCLVSLITLSAFLFACNQKADEGAGEITSTGVKVAYYRCGNSDTTLLFIHGWCINKEYWNEQLAYFCSRYTVVTVDLPGFGMSGKNRRFLNFDAYTRDVKKLIEELHLKNVVLIGHSMSGDIVLKADNEYPELLAGIVGVDNLHEPGKPMTAEETDQTETFFNMLYISFDSTVTTYMKSGLFQPSTDSAIVARVMNDIYNADSSAATRALRSLTVVAQEEQQLMKGLSHKLFLVNSDVNSIDADALNKYCAKGFEAVYVKGTGHYPMIEKPGEFNAALQKVVDQIGKEE